jgi:GrpB-like predicted nucleotidyltransferase (UPF0157 family)
MPTRDEILSFDETPAPTGSSPWVVEPTRAPLELVEYDAAWSSHAAVVVARVRAALGTRALRVEHVGSTAVPGLAAKPVIDLDLTVADPDAEAGWLPHLEAAGFVLTVREPWWHGHRMLRGGGRSDDAVSPRDGGPAANLHVFGPDSPELVKHVVFRDWLRASAEDRDLYATTKRAAVAASGEDSTVMEYNARKQAVIREIYDRAFSAAGFFDGVDRSTDLIPERDAYRIRPP